MLHVSLAIRATLNSIMQASASLQHASAIFTRMCLSASFPDSAGCSGQLINCEHDYA